MPVEVYNLDNYYSALIESIILVVQANGTKLIKFSLLRFVLIGQFQVITWRDEYMLL